MENTVQKKQNAFYTFLNRKYADDQKISFAIAMSIFYFLIINTPEAIWGAFLPGGLIIKGICCAAAALMSLPGVIVACNRNFKVLLIMLSIFAVGCIWTAVCFPAIDAKLLLSMMTEFTVFGAAAFTLALSIEDFGEMWKVLKDLSYWMAALGIIYYLCVLHPDDAYSMSFSMVVFIPMVVLVMNFLETHHWYDIVLALMLLIAVFTRGSRGVLLCLFVAIALVFFSWLFSNKVRNKMSKWLYVTIVIGIFVGIALFFINIESILTGVGIVLEKLGMDGRTASLFSEGNVFYVSGRNYIADAVIGDISKDIFAPHGIYGTGLTVGTFMQIGMGGGLYAHNIFLELVHTFGIIGGGIFSVSMIVLIVTGFIKAKEKYERNIIILFFSLG
ncbi:MAG: hypothetical protein RR956_07015, partial [Christensenella sp.]